jgi:hypothetical protein
MVAASLTLVLSSTRIGATLGDCCEPESASGGREPTVHADRTVGSRLPLARSAVHGVAFALQGIALLLLVPTGGPLIVAAFALGGVTLSYLWYRWAAIPHALDMCFGMLTLGNLGMLLGWWADNGFAALSDHGCCACVEAMRAGVMMPWMWVGMLVFANAAMLWLPRRSVRHGTNHTLAMYTGGNVGMVVGMLGGGWCASQFETASVGLAVAASFAGMTVGMLAGMLFGTWVTERVLTAVPRALRTPQPGRLTNTAG